MFWKKKKKLFGNEVEPDCAYCANSSGETCTLDSTQRPCEHFHYDPLKRTPDAAPLLKHYNENEFKL